MILNSNRVENVNKIENYSDSHRQHRLRKYDQNFMKIASKYIFSFDNNNVRVTKVERNNTLKDIIITDLYQFKKLQPHKYPTIQAEKVNSKLMNETQQNKSIPKLFSNDIINFNVMNTSPNKSKSNFFRENKETVKMKKIPKLKIENPQNKFNLEILKNLAKTKDTSSKIISSNVQINGTKVVTYSRNLMANIQLEGTIIEKFKSADKRNFNKQNKITLSNRDSIYSNSNSNSNSNCNKLTENLKFTKSSSNFALLKDGSTQTQQTQLIQLTQPAQSNMQTLNTIEAIRKNKNYLNGIVNNSPSNNFLTNLLNKKR